MRHIGFVLSPSFQVMSLAALTAFELANAVTGEEHYKTHFV